MIEARSTLLGQRVEQVSHEAQYQMERPASTRSYCPSCRKRTIRFGGCSMKERMGQPAEHLPHWKQRRTELPDRASTFRTKPRFIVSVESCILECFTGPPHGSRHTGTKGAGLPAHGWSGGNKGRKWEENGEVYVDLTEWCPFEPSLSLLGLTDNC